MLLDRRSDQQPPSRISHAGEPIAQLVTRTNSLFRLSLFSPVLRRLSAGQATVLVLPGREKNGQASPWVRKEGAEVDKRQSGIGEAACGNA